MGDIPSGGIYCQSLDGSLPDGTARSSCNTREEPTDSGDAADSGDARPTAFVDAGTVATRTDGSDAK